MIRIKKSNSIGLILIALFCAASSLAIMFNASGKEQILIGILPVIYIFCIVLSGAFDRLFDTSTPGFLLINLLYFIKCGVYPFFCVIFRTTYISGNSDTFFAVILEIIELLVIYSVYYIYHKFTSEKNDLSLNPISSKNGLNNGRFVLLAFMLFAVAIVLIFPSSLSAYNLFSVKSVEIINAGMSEAGDNSFASVVLVLTRHVAVVYFIGLFFNRYISTHRIRYIIYSVMIVALSMMIVRGVSRSDFVIPGICGVFMLVRLFPKQKKYIIGILVGALSIIFLVFSVMRFGRISDGAEFAKMLQAYLCGEKNMAIAIQARRFYSEDIGIKTMFSDLFGNWMVVGRLFRGTYNISELFNFTFYGSKISHDQIVPTVGQSYMQFGLPGTYIYTVIMTLICLKFDSMFKNCTEIDFSYIYLYGAIKCAVTLMGNFKIFSATVFNVLIPLWLLFYVNKRLVLKKQEIK